MPGGHAGMPNRFRLVALTGVRSLTMVLHIATIILPLFAGIVVATPLVRRLGLCSVRGWMIPLVLAAVGLAAAVGHLLLVMAVPFRGAATEAPLLAATAAAFVPALLLAFGFGM